MHYYLKMLTHDCFLASHSKAGPQGNQLILFPSNLNNETCLDYHYVYIKIYFGYRDCGCTVALYS